MEFAFTDEQKMIRDTAELFLAEISCCEAVRQAMATEQGYDLSVWTRMCEEMCWQAIHVPEQYGGLGLGYVELVAVLEQMGRYLLCSPFYSTVCLAANALLLAGSEGQKGEYLPNLCDGSLTATLAFSGIRGGADSGAVDVTAERDGDHFILNGTYRYVIDGHTADLLIAAAREPGSKGSEGVSLFLLSADCADISRRWLPTMDQTRKQAEIICEDVRVPASALMGGLPGEAGEQLECVLSLAAIALSAEQVGGSQRVMDMAVEYTKERVQFNRSIASFQVVKHKAADMMLKTEGARSAAYYAACVADEALSADNFVELNEAASIAKTYCSEAFFSNSAEAIQLHGGVGFTWEYDVHLYFKRAKAAEHLLGNGSYHREKLAAQLLDQSGGE